MSPSGKAQERRAFRNNCQGFRTISNRALLDRLQELVEAGVDIDKIPLSLTVNELIRLPIEKLRETTIAAVNIG